MPSVHVKRHNSGEFEESKKNAYIKKIKQGKITQM